MTETPSQHPNATRRRSPLVIVIVIVVAVSLVLLLLLLAGSVVAAWFLTAGSGDDIEVSDPFPIPPEGSTELQALRIPFGEGSVELRPAASPDLDRAASILVANPAFTRIRVEGHTDDREADAATRQALSERRAQAVKAELVARGVEADRLTAQGLGSERSAAPNDTAAGRESNRRVEFVIVQGAL